ncbi:MAG: methyltransferase [Bacteroidetes bacterium]|nr:methyltransferase [Bacteroidota bacterium]
MLNTLAKGINFLSGGFLQKKRIVICGSLTYLERNRNLDKNYFDYVRLSTLELISYEINKKQLAGDVAELGVYKGRFAKYINQYFPDRSLYLFDTFEGFDTRDVKSETENSFSTGNQDFSNTSVELVLKLMVNREKCIPVKGFFPESAKNIAGEFVFVSLDADLYEPIYHGLQFFYPKLVEGGYIFIHDFNNDNYKGARKAVEQYCEEQKLNYLPIPDSGGSAVIIK